ncbi:MAG TPA: hypothetical protein VKH19_14540 [Gemmatimonadaceae bacterium]|nr:hypothetical protein [Gemmatimonadaceae bacterium]
MAVIAVLVNICLLLALVEKKQFGQLTTRVARNTVWKLERPSLAASLVIAPLEDACDSVQLRRNFTNADRLRGSFWPQLLNVGKLSSPRTDG